MSKPIDFDKAASTWDLEPRRIQMVADVAQAMAAELALSPEMEVLDFGCGTGLLTLHLHPLVGRITGADTSRGMLEALVAKLQDQGIANVSTLLLDEDPAAPLPGAYDLIVSNMTLHHVQDVAGLLGRMRQALKPGGRVCLTDLDLDNGEFHGDAAGVFHDGFGRDWLRGQFEAAGLPVEAQRTAATMRKPGGNGAPRDFTIFMTIGRKPAA
ncbi:MAG: class I SAM-dependent methyltransferase [Pseudomonadota bacterium]